MKKRCVSKMQSTNLLSEKKEKKTNTKKKRSQCRRRKKEKDEEDLGSLGHHTQMLMRAGWLLPEFAVCVFIITIKMIMIIVTLSIFICKSLN
jgi:hypothetical protein